MGIRKRGYWLRQADAIRRKEIATIASGVAAGIGMAFSEEGQSALDWLELTKTEEESKAEGSENNWNMLFMLGGGKGV